VILAVGLGVSATPAAASSLVIPGSTEAVPGVNRILSVARTELAKRPAERGSDNVPRYHGGKGRIAPYSISAAWCVAFATWTWDHAGFTDYQGTKLVWPSEDGTPVAVQVRDLSRWAQRGGYWSFRAQAGYLVVYGRGHIGVITKVDRDGRAIASIEGNKSDRVSKVVVPFDEVTGYISPVRLSAGQAVSRTSARADVD